MEEIKLLFATKWENETSKLACLIASYTGMRQGEIAALRLQDIGEDRIYIRHSWEKDWSCITNVVICGIMV